MKPDEGLPGDQAFRATSDNMRLPEMTYGGALSFLRRRYSRDLAGPENGGIDLAIAGVPFDNAVTYRPGCRLGPRAIRAASVQLAELKAFPWGFDPLQAIDAVDYGDFWIDPHLPMEVTQSIEAQAANVIKNGTKLLSLGGDHYVSYPLLRAHAQKYGPLALIQIDAHCDTWEDIWGEEKEEDQSARIDHGTMFARAAREGIIDVRRSTQIGLRTQNDHDHGFEILTAPFIHREGVSAALEIATARAGDGAVYISFDIDGLDPAFAPGTGTPVPGGLASWQALELMRGFKDLNLVGMDIVEVSPPFDHAEITALAAAHIAHEFLCILAYKKGARENPVGRG